jgi:hypothetical protein
LNLNFGFQNQKLQPKFQKQFYFSLVAQVQFARFLLAAQSSFVFLFFVFLSRQPKSFLAHSAFVAHRRSTQSLPSSSGSCRHLLCSPSGKRQCPIGFPPITGALKAIKTHRHRSSSHLPSRPSTPIKGSNTTGKLYPNSFYPQLSFFMHRAPCHQAQVTAFFLPHHRPRSYPPLALAAHSKDRLILLILPELSW